MSAASLERALRRAHRERRRRRLSRRAYATIYRRIAHLVPVVLSTAGEMRAFPLLGDSRRVVNRLAPGCVFGFETALELWKGRRLLTARDLHAYTTDPFPAVAADVGPEVSLAGVVPVWDRPPHLFLIRVPALPPAIVVGPWRVVSAEWLLREYLGTVGHRFDLLAVLCHCLGRVDPGSRALGERSLNP